MRMLRVIWPALRRMPFELHGYKERELIIGTFGGAGVPPAFPSPPIPTLTS
jgi:hypothetical protein